jgi:hypothetical protein
MSQTYPLMRGTAPLLVALISVLAPIVSPGSPGPASGGLSILAMAMNGRMHAKGSGWRC